MYRLLSAGTAFVLAVSTMVVFAQNEPIAPKPASPQQENRGDAWEKRSQKQSDEILASMLLIENRNEVALAQLALEKASDADVKVFAKQMDEDHTQFGKKLEVCCASKTPGATGAGGADTTKPAEPDRAQTKAKDKDSGERKTAAQNSERRSEKPLDTPADHIAMLNELGPKCLESTKRALADKQGRDFDRCYVNGQVAAHQRVLDTIEVFQGYASPTLREVLDAGAITVRMHLEHAKELAKRLDEHANQ